MISGGDFIGRDQITITEETAYDVRDLPNPYLGLRSYTYADRDAYAGREALVEESVATIASPQSRRALTFVTGASGTCSGSYPRS